MRTEGALTPEERLLRLALRIAAPIFAVETLVYLLPALVGSAKHDWIQLPFVDNSIVKAGLLGTVCWIAGADVRRFSPVVSIVIAGTGTWVAGSAAMLIWADTSPHYTLLGVDLSITAILWLGIALEGSLTVLFAWLHRRAVRARWRLRYFGPAQFGTLAALAEVLVIGESKLALSTAGRNLCFNMGSPMTADFEEELHSYDGLQISHFFEESPQRGFVLETWFNPVVAQALTMPGWLDDHYRNMHRYAHLTATGVLVGTDRNASVRKALTGGPDIVYQPTKDDLAKLIDGLILAGRIYLAAGAKRVMPTTFSYLEFSDEAELKRLGELIRDDADISMGTGHPQGGNAIARDPERGVVDPDFRVHGMENLHVCDASVFPSSTTVNPQMTVMALAEYAAPRIT